MKNKHYLFTGFLFLNIAVQAQVKIGDNSTTVNSASLLELETTDKGFVLPRVSITDVSTSSPLASGVLTGTVVYNTNSSATGGSGTGVYYWDGSNWNFLTNTTTSLNYWSLTGNSGLSASTNFIGTTNAVDLVVKTNNATRMRIKSTTGFIGINTTSPSERLHVVGNFYLNGAFMPGGSAGTAGDILTSAGTGTSPTWTNPNSLAWALLGNSGTSASANFIGTTDAVDFITKTNNTERLRVTSGGNVGIGLTNPSYALSVLSVSNPLYLSGVQATLTLSSDSVVTINGGLVKKTPYSSFTNAFWGLTGNAGTTASTNFIGTTDAVDFIAKTNNLERMRVTSGGNVGINTSSPGSALDVKGTLRLSGSGSGYVALAPAAAAGSTTYTLPSADGTSGQALITNGSGTLSWAITAATIGTIGAGSNIAGTATGKYYCTGSYITLPPGKFIVNVYMMLSSSPSTMTQTISNTPGSFFIKSFFADASLGTTAGATVSPALPQSNVSPDVVGNGKLISGSLSVGQTYNPISGSVVINNTSGANKSYYYWAGWVSLTNVLSTNSLPLIGGTNYGEDNIVAYPSN